MVLLRFVLMEYGLEYASHQIPVKESQNLKKNLGHLLEK